MSVNDDDGWGDIREAVALECELETVSTFAVLRIGSETKKLSEDAFSKFSQKIHDYLDPEIPHRRKLAIHFCDDRLEAKEFLAKYPNQEETLFLLVDDTGSDEDSGDFKAALKLRNALYFTGWAALNSSEALVKGHCEGFLAAMASEGKVDTSANEVCGCIAEFLNKISLEHKCGLDDLAPKLYAEILRIMDEEALVGLDPNANRAGKPCNVADSVTLASRQSAEPRFQASDRFGGMQAGFTAQSPSNQDGRTNHGQEFSRYSRRGNSDYSNFLPRGSYQSRRGDYRRPQPSPRQPWIPRPVATPGHVNSSAEESESCPTSASSSSTRTRSFTFKAGPKMLDMLEAVHKTNWSAAQLRAAFQKNVALADNLLSMKNPSRSVEIMQRINALITEGLASTDEDDVKCWAVILVYHSKILRTLMTVGKTSVDLKRTVKHPRLYKAIRIALEQPNGFTPHEFVRVLSEEILDQFESAIQAHDLSQFLIDAFIKLHRIGVVIAVVYLTHKLAKCAAGKGECHDMESQELMPLLNLVRTVLKSGEEDIAQATGDFFDGWQQGVCNHLSELAGYKLVHFCFQPDLVMAF
ncbi:unnamed protein product, partial [Mesorhabditis spiculigera]